VAEETSGYRAEVHQATGMVSVQLDVSQAVALVRLRAYAFSEHRPLADVAADVVARRMRFDDNDD
jgi:AmiR/NasT family two-component response regulator